MTFRIDQQSVVLIIDDNSQVRDAICDILNMYDIGCLVAADGQEGVEQYRENQAVIGLVLLDLHMPNMGGAETLDALLQFDPQVRVLISSSVAEPGVIQGLLADGALGYLRKPYDVQTLIEAVQSALDGSADNDLFIRESPVPYSTAAVIH